jgi:hypothetical protein
MTTLQKWTVGLVLALLAAMIAGAVWQMEVRQAAVAAQTAAKIDELAAQIKARDAQAATAVKAVDAQVQAAKTPDQQAALIQALAGLKVTPTIVTVPAAPVAGLAAPLPNAPQPGDMIVPKADIPQTVNFAANCKKDAIDLSACEGNLSDMNKERAELQSEVTELKGGTWWTRLKRNSKWAAIGGALAAGAVCATGHCK